VRLIFNKYYEYVI